MDRLKSWRGANPGEKGESCYFCGNADYKRLRVFHSIGMKGDDIDRDTKGHIVVCLVCMYKLPAYDGKRGWAGCGCGG